MHPIPYARVPLVPYEPGRVPASIADFELYLIKVLLRLDVIERYSAGLPVHVFLPRFSRT